jgi:hypothetical protein
MKIVLPAILTRFGSRADNSFSVSFVTDELSTQQLMEMNQLKSQYGFLMFKDSQVEKVEQESFDSLEADLYDNKKTQSQRLRGVLYKIWELDNKGYTDFKDFYKHETERIIEHYKSKLS